MRKTTDSTMEEDGSGVGNVQETRREEVWANGSTPRQIAQEPEQPVKNIVSGRKKV